ncbi:hypothetical protein D9M71_714570 [compost metagenome]
MGGLHHDLAAEQDDPSLPRVEADIHGGAAVQLQQGVVGQAHFAQLAGMRDDVGQRIAHRQVAVAEGQRQRAGEQQRQPSAGQPAQLASRFAGRA